MDKFDAPDVLAHLRLHDFFLRGLKYSTKDREVLDSEAYEIEHHDFYSEALRELVPKVWGKDFSDDEKIFDLGGQAGRAYLFLKDFLPLSSYVVIDRYYYEKQSKKLRTQGLLPLLIQECWFDYFERIESSEAKNLFIFSFSINECADFDSQLYLIHLIKKKFPRSHILILDRSFLVEELHRLLPGSSVFDVRKRLARPLYQFSDGHYLRRKLEEKALYL